MTPLRLKRLASKEARLRFHLLRASRSHPDQNCYAMKETAKDQNKDREACDNCADNWNQDGEACENQAAHRNQDGEACVKRDESLDRYTRRKKGHDYHAPCIYHLILKKREDAQVFGHLTGSPYIQSGMEGCVKIEKTVIGTVISRFIYNLPKRYPILRLHQYMVMPDHVHILLQVLERSEKALGYYVAALKVEIIKELARRLGNGDVFQKNYTDRIIHPRRSLDTVYKYIKDNPYRLAVRKACPGFFRKVRDFEIEGERYNAYGNLFHLRNPFKSAVIVHRKDTDEEFARKQEDWLGSVIEGGVLVSPFISKREKEIRCTAESLGGRIILVSSEPMGERFKPAEHDFNLCAEGRLLIIAPQKPLGEGLTRAICYRLNALAEAIAKL